MVIHDIMNYLDLKTIAKSKGICLLEPYLGD